MANLPRDRRTYTVAFACGNLRLISSLILSSHGTVSEEVTLVDIAQPVATDRVLLHDRTFVGLPTLLIELPSLDHMIRTGQGAPHDLCLERMHFKLLWLKSNPEQSEAFLRSLKPHTETVGTLSAWRTAYTKA
ncbi:MAG: hypothetical protein WC786_04155 [Patescibacteria group bacterium]